MNGQVQHILWLHGTEPGKNVLQEVVGGFILTLQIVYSIFEGDDMAYLDWTVFEHLGM